MEKNLLDTPVSYFAHVGQTTSSGTIPLSEFLFGDKYRAQVEAVRSCGDKEERCKLKKNMPCATISAVFPGRRAVKEEHRLTHLVCIDVDGKDNLGKTAEELKAALFNLPCCVYSGLSVSGEGAFGIMLLPHDIDTPKDFARAYKHLSCMLFCQGIRTDKACTDITRLRIISYDPAALVRTDPRPAEIPAEIVAPKPRTRPMLTKGARPRAFRRAELEWHRDEAKIMTAADMVATRGLVIRPYEDWVRCAIALQPYPQGEDFFVALSSTWSEEQRQDPRDLFHEIKRHGYDQVNIGTLYHILDGLGLPEREIFKEAKKRHPGLFGPYWNGNTMRG